jgi:asparagine synthase (glutamine-hydrolysing)
MLNKSQDAVIVFNGEIYNSHYLSNILAEHNVHLRSSSDTEIIMCFYDLFGIHKTLEILEGMFAIVIYDLKKEKIFLCRDKFGQKPLFYKTYNDELIFASEIKGIIRYEGAARLDYDSIINPLFTTGLPPRSKTCFENISTMMPGQALMFDVRTSSLEDIDYFDINDLVDEELYRELDNSSITTVARRFNELLHESVQCHLLSDAPLASLFSLGLDSTVISIIASQYKEIDLYHLRTKLDDTDKHMQQFVRGHNNRVSVVDEVPSTIFKDYPKMSYHYEMPNKPEGLYLSLLCEEARRDEIKVLLTGDAADELFGGYGGHLGFYVRNRLFNSRTKRFISKAVKHFIPGTMLDMPDCNPLGTDYNTFPPFRNVDEVPLNILYHKGRRLKEWNTRLEKFNFVEKPFEQATSAYLLDEIGYRLERFLIRGDRFGMMNSVELRNPFLFTPLVRLAINTPVRFKIRRNGYGGYTQKLILKEVAKMNGVPKSIISRRKIGTPLVQKGYLDKMINSIQFSGLSELLGIDNEDIKYSLLRSYDVNIDRMKYAFLSVEMMHRMFVLGESYEAIGQEIGVLDLGLS